MKILLPVYHWHVRLVTRERGGEGREGGRRREREREGGNGWSWKWKNRFYLIANAIFTNNNTNKTIIIDLFCILVLNCIITLFLAFDKTKNIYPSSFKFQKCI